MGRHPISRGEAGAANSSGFIKVRNLGALFDLLRESGVDEAQLVGRAGIEIETLSDPENFVGYEAVGKLVSECAHVTKCDEFGFRVGMRLDASALGLVGLAAAHAPTLGEALHVLNKYLKATASGVTVAVDRRNAVAFASTTLVNADVPGADHILDAALAHLCNILRETCNANWRPVEVLMTRPRPKDARVFADFYKAPVKYNAIETALVIETPELDKTIAGRNPRQFQVLVSVLDHGVSEQPISLRVELKSVLRQQLVAGPPTIRRAASAFGLSERTFVRRLEHAELSFSGLVDEVRYETARSLLRADIGFAEIAAVLGYAEPSVFTRSFKRWCGETPSAWRRKYAFSNEPA